MPSSVLAPRVPAMCGRATLAMEVSSTSMNAASATVMAISQGLTRGFHRAAYRAAIGHVPLGRSAKSLRDKTVLLIKAECVRAVERLGQPKRKTSARACNTGSYTDV